MATLIAIGYPDETTAATAAEQVQRMADRLAIQPESVAVIRRDREGKVRVTTNHHATAARAGWGMLWGFLFGMLFFVPLFGMAVGAGLGALLRKVEKAGLTREFRDRVRDMLQPGTSALFLVVDQVTPEAVVEALGQYGGVVLTSSLSEKAEAELQRELHGTAQRGVSVP